ncbi:hypothetical protein Tco_0276750 [Tanacetum coccineum]
MAKYDMSTTFFDLTKDSLRALVKTYRIPLDLHPRLTNPGLSMDCLPSDAICIYTQFLRFFGLRIPFSMFLLSVLKYFKVYIFQLVPLGLNEIVPFEIVCRDLGITPTVNLFRVFQILCKQGDWFSFVKRRNTQDICTDDGPSSIKLWKKKFFLIDRRLCAYLTRLREVNESVLVRFGLSSAWFNQKCDPVFRKKDDKSEMSIYDFMTLPSWENAKVVEEPYERPRRKASKAGFSAPTMEQAEDVDDVDLSDTDYCAFLEVTFSDPSHVGTSNATNASSFDHDDVRKGTDIAKISRKRSKPDNHGHGNGIECAKAGRMLSKSYTSPNAPIGGNPKGNDTRAKEKTHLSSGICTKRLEKEAQWL